MGCRTDNHWLDDSRRLPAARTERLRETDSLIETGFVTMSRAFALSVLGAMVILQMTAVSTNAGVAGGQKVLARHSGAPIQLRSAPLTVSIPLNGDSWAVQAAGDRGQLALELQGVEFNGPAGVYYDIYIDLPPDVQNPASNSTHFVGKLTPRAERSKDPASNSGAHVPYSIADVVRGLTRAKTFNPDVMTITFVPRGLGTSEGGRHARVSTVRARISGLRILATT